MVKLILGDFLGAAIDGQILKIVIEEVRRSLRARIALVLWKISHRPGVGVPCSLDALGRLRNNVEVAARR